MILWTSCQHIWLQPVQNMFSPHDCICQYEAAPLFFFCLLRALLLEAGITANKMPSNFLISKEKLVSLGGCQRTKSLDRIIRRLVSALLFLSNIYNLRLLLPQATLIFQLTKKEKHQSKQKTKKTEATEAFKKKKASVMLDTDRSQS